MFKPVYLKLAWETLKKNYRISVPFILGGSLMEAIVYSITSMTDNPDLISLKGGATIISLLSVAQGVMVFFSFLFYLYLNSVLSKNRKQEQGLYTVLGMGKPHLVRILFYQYLILMLAIMVCGLAGGILFDKAMFLLFAALSGMPVPMGFYISWEAIGYSLLMTLVMMVLLLVLSAFTMLRTNPLELLKGENIGEKQLKNRWILALLGLVSLGIGYWLALTVKNPVEALLYFFVAVIFVIIGTYLLFLFGFTCLIRMMEKNKRFYYKPKHFISVSTMKYRIKASAASLASITILSTAVLVAVSASASLISGSNALVESLYPKEALMTFTGCKPAQSEMVENAAKKAIQESGMAQGEAEVYRSSSFLAAKTADGYTMLSPESTKEETSNPLIVTVIPESDYNRVLHQDLHLENGQVYAYEPDNQSGTLSLDGKSWKLKEMPEQLKSFGGMSSEVNTMGYAYHFLVLSEQDYLEIASSSDCIIYAYFDLSQEAKTILEENGSADTAEGQLNEDAGFDKVAVKVWDIFNPLLDQESTQAGVDPETVYAYASMEFKEDYAAQLNSLYSGVLFIGIYVSVMFAVAVILIMYYKQISEGTDDRKRFAILQNVGLEQKQIRRIINDQVVLIFFVPLGMAALHLCFAFPMLQRILRAIGQINASLFILVTLISFGLFALLYIIAYRLTARTYYRMVRSAGLR